MVMNSRLGISNLVYRYRFWGLPKGVNIPPRFAAMFCMIKVKAIYFCLPVELSTKNPRGRKVNRAMSLAMSMEPIKVIYTRARTLSRALRKHWTIFWARM